jgi:hypothetical protein
MARISSRQRIEKVTLRLLISVIIMSMLGAAFTVRAEMPADSTGTSPEPMTEKRWSSFLPLMSEEAAKRGIQLPLPFGVSTVFVTLFNRKVDITDVRVGVNGAPPRSVSRFVDLGSTTDIVFNANLKLDAWLLPFLNVYLLAGYVYNESTTHANITVPGSPNFSTELKTTLSGFVGGGGMTLAGGYDDFFMVADANWVQTDLGFDDKFKALIATVRAGWNGRIESNPLQLWIGEGYWDTRNTAKGHTNVPGVGNIVFEADQGPKYIWMTDVGANLQIKREFLMVLDFGFDFHGGYAVVVGPTYRF